MVYTDDEQMRQLWWIVEYLAKGERHINFIFQIRLNHVRFSLVIYLYLLLAA